LQQNAMSLLQGLMGQAQQPTFENMYRQPTMGIIPGAASSLAQGAGQGAGQYATMQGMRKLGIF
jgi:hypothetical protein